MALDFPTPSNTGEIHNENGYRFVWDGSKWQSQQASSAYNLQIVTGNTKAEVVDTGSDGHFKVTTEGTERLRIDSSGNVGIGTTSPNYPLHLNRSGTTSVYQQFTNGDTGTGSSDGFQVGINTTGDGILLQNENKAIRSFTNGSERMRISSSGNVGIGTTSPDAKLHVAGTTRLGANDATDAVVEIGAGATGNRNAFIDLVGDTTYSDYGLRVQRDNSGANTTSRLLHRGTGDFRLIAQEAAQLEFWTSNTERLSIDSSGKVGIGQSSPNALLEIKSDTAGNEVQRIEGNYAGSGSVVLSNWRRAGGAVAANLQYHDSSPIKMNLGTTTSHNFALKTGDTDRLTIDTSGRVLVGTTTEGEGDADNFTVADSGNCGITIRSGTTSNGNIYFSDATSGDGEYVGFMQYRHNDNALAIGTAATERMRIDSSGRLAVGTTSPNNYYANQLVVDTGSSAQSGITIVSGTSAQGMFAFADGTSGADRYRGFLDYNHSNNSLAFGTDGNERMRLDGSGRLLIGTTSAREHLNDGNDSAQIFLQGTTQNTSTLAVVRSSNNDGPAHLVLGKARGTGITSTGLVQDGDTIGSINFEAADGSHLIRAGQISGVVDGTPGANDMPGSLKFSTTANGSNNLTQRMRITNQGRVDIFASNLTDSHFISSAASAGTAIEFIKCMHSASSIGSGTTSFKVATNGNVQNTNNTYDQISDVKLKENIVDANSQWDDIKAVQIRNYNFKEETGHETHTQIGVVAQELETVSPGLVYETPDTDHDGNDLGTVTKAVHTSVLYMKAVKALQEAMDRIETLEAKVAALEAE